MNIIVDSNILISALIKDSITRRIVIQCNDTFLSPEVMVEEIEKHLDVISAKSGLSYDDIEKVMDTLLKYINIISFNEIKDSINAAERIMGKIDPSDVIFVAAALSKNAAIWSDDKDFQKQNKIDVFTTKDMIKRML
ncbi:MAG: PIN domain-containing protein [Thermoplasmata archaeon]|nr:PIN domain-containing protein [Thermoplasmata archaeon]